MELMNLEQSLFDEISQMIDQSRRAIAAQVNNTAILTFWRVGNEKKGIGG